MIQYRIKGKEGFSEKLPTNLVEQHTRRGALLLGASRLKPWLAIGIFHTAMLTPWRIDHFRRTLGQITLLFPVAFPVRVWDE